MAGTTMIAARTPTSVLETHKEDGAESLSRFMALPDELLLLIIEQVDSQDALACLSATCSKLRDMVEPYSLKSRFVRAGTQARRLAEILHSRPKRMLYIQDLSIRYVWEDEEGIEALDGVMKELTHLRDLTIESPCLNNDPWRNDPHQVWTSHCRIDYPSLIQSSVFSSGGAPLTMPFLQSLTLHAHGSGQDCFSFDKSYCIFLHPSLRNLNISCADIQAYSVLGDDFTDEIWSKIKTTPLTSLTFVECNISVAALAIALWFPKALKHLDIGERLYRFQDPRPHQLLGSEPAKFLRALEHQKDSLVTLRHVGGGMPWSREPLDGTLWDKFSSLTELRFGFDSILVKFFIHNNVPESVQKVQVDGPMLEIDWHWELYQRIALGRIPQTCHFEICFSRTNASDPVNRFPLIWQNHPGARDMIYGIAKPLKARGGRFTILGERFTGDRAFIPPFLYGEDLPEEVLLYDSNDLYRFAGDDFAENDEDSNGPDEE